MSDQNSKPDPYGFLNYKEGWYVRDIVLRPQGLLDLYHKSGFVQLKVDANTLTSVDWAITGDASDIIKWRPAQ